MLYEMLQRSVVVYINNILVNFHHPVEMNLAKIPLIPLLKKKKKNLSLPERNYDWVSRDS